MPALDTICDLEVEIARGELVVFIDDRSRKIALATTAFVASPAVNKESGSGAQQPNGLAIVIFLIDKFLFKSTTIDLVALALFASNLILDFFSGHPHNVFGEDTHQVGLGLYATNAYLAILIEAVFVAAALWYYFRAEAKEGLRRTFRNRAIIIGVFANGIKQS